MTRAPFMPLFVGDYWADTRHLRFDENGAYVQLLMAAWMRDDCRLPDDDKLLARMLGISAKRWARLKPTVMAFWTLNDGHWEQKRLSKERQFVAKKSLTNSEAANARWAKSLKNKGDGDADAMQAQCERNADGYAPTPTPTPTPTVITGTPDGVPARLAARSPAKEKLKLAFKDNPGGLMARFERNWKADPNRFDSDELVAWRDLFADFAGKADSSAPEYHRAERLIGEIENCFCGGAEEQAQ